MKRLLACAVSLTLAMGCSSGPANQVEEAEGFALVQHDATTLEATYRSGGASVRALVVETSKNVVEVTYDFYGLGSFAAASDDYSFASNNCSCSGVGTCG